MIESNIANIYTFFAVYKKYVALVKEAYFSIDKVQLF